MRGWFIRFSSTALALYLCSRVFGGVVSEGLMATLWAAFFLGVVNMLLRPIVFFLTLPLTFFTLGLFILVVNGLMLVVVGWIVPGFEIHGLGTAVLAAIVVSVVSWIANGLVSDRGRVEVIVVRRGPRR